MAALVGALRVTLGANTAQYEAGMRRAQRTARSTGQSIQQSMLAAQRSAQTSFRLIGAAVAAFGTAAAVRGMASLIDASKNIEAQLRLATRESGNFAQAQEDVRRIAATTRSGLEETADLYATIQRTARELGIEQRDVARATETVNKTFQISGATAAEAAGGTRQFLQALQSGTLRGEEFNSVLENAPRLARLLAQSLGVSIGQLREMAKEGEITGDKLLRALTERRFTDQIDSEFRELPQTFDQAMTRMRNSALEFFGGFDRGGRFSEAIIGFASDGQDTFENIARAGEETGQTLRSIFEGLRNVFDPMGEGATNIFEFIRNEARGLQTAIADILGSIDWLSTTVNIRGETSNLGLADRFLAGQPGLLSGAFALAGRAARDLRPGSGGALPRSSPSSGGRSGGRGGRGSAEAAARRAEREREQALREEAEFYSQMRQFRADILRAQQDQVNNVGTRNDLEMQVLDIEREQYTAQLALQVQLGDLTQARAQELQQAYDQVDEERRHTLRLEQMRDVDEQTQDIARARFDIAGEALQQEAELADTAAEQRDVQMRLLELAYRHERARLEAVLADETASQAAVEEARLRLAALDQWRARERQIISQRTQGPLESFLDSLPTTAERANEALQMVAAEGLQSIEDGLVAALMGTKSLADAFRDMAASIIADLLRIQIQRLITIPLANAIGGSLFGGGGGAAASAVSTFSSIFNRAPGFASGGSIRIGGRPGTDRNLLSLNGMPIARVSSGEEVDIRNGRRGESNVYNINVGSPNTGDPRRDRQTMYQQGAIVRDAIARTAKTGH